MCWTIKISCIIYTVKISFLFLWTLVDPCSKVQVLVWPEWLNGWVFVYELSGRGFESRCSLLNFRFRACFGQGVPWHSGKYRVWIHSETRTWHGKNIQSVIVKVLHYSYHRDTSNLVNTSLNSRELQEFT